MQCPVDGQTLTMSERSGIEMDYCPQCRGVWLDRGELDKLIERAPTQADTWDSAQRDRGSDRDDYKGDYKKSKHSRRGSWLGELFGD